MITFPYISRVLEPDGVGKVNLALSIVGYFVMISQVGIPVYGIKEIAKVRDNKEKLGKIFSELFIINLIMMAISLSIYLTLFLFVEKIQNDKILFMVVGINIILNLFSIDWFYSGIEEYKYITIRSLVVRVLSIFLLFIFVKEKQDYIYYAGLNVLSVGGANIANVIGIKKYINIQFREINIKRHFKAISLLFLAGIIGSIYGNLDVILLGFMGGDVYVGYYSTNRKITSLGITFVTSLGTVLIPRVSYYLNNNLKNEYNKIMEKSINFIYFVSFPAITYIVFMSKELLILFGGEKFMPASISLSIISFQILATSLATFFGFQVILANNDEKTIMKSNITGAIVNVGINLIFIKHFLHNATSFAIVISESLVVITQIILAKKYITFKLFNRNSQKYLFGSLIMTVPILLLKNIGKENHFYSIIITFLISSLVYICCLVLIKEMFIKELFLKIAKKRG